MTEFEGTPCAVKVACTVWSGGKSGDNFKGLPITIRRKCSCTVEKHKTWIASPATIPKSGERNRKIHSCMLYLISI